MNRKTLLTLKMFVALVTSKINCLLFLRISHSGEFKSPIKICDPGRTHFLKNVNLKGLTRKRCPKSLHPGGDYSSLGCARVLGGHTQHQKSFPEAAARIWSADKQAP